MVILLRSFAGTSRSTLRLHQSNLQKTISLRALQTSAIISNAQPTGSEDAVHAEKHDAGPEELQKKTAQKADAEKHHSSSSPNDKPTSSEDSVHADKHSHDPLPDHKKKGKGKKK